jgi:general secretion pathway protein N
MKKWFAYGAIFLSIYVVFLVATMPVAWVASFVNLPKNSQISELTGTVWQSHATQVYINDVEINDVKSDLSFISLLMFDPKVTLTFGGALVKGPEGQLTASQLLGELKITELDINVAANLIAEKLTLAIPVEGHNFIDIKVNEFVLGKPVCEQMRGSVIWKKAAVTALSEKVKLGTLSADLACNKGALIFTVSPKNDLGLTFTAYIRSMKKVSGNGYLKPGAKFPEKIRPLLSFIGKADNQGRYRLNF